MAAAMGPSQGLPCLLLLCLGFTLCTAGVPGTEFITAFMQNHNKNTGNPTLSLTITALQDSTTGSVTVSNLVNQTFTLNKLEKTTVQLPSKIQLTDSGTSLYVVSVKSNKPVSVVSLNFKEQTSESASLFPVTELGKEYYIVTPPDGSFKEFAIITKELTQLTIYPTGALVYSGKNYAKGKSFVFYLGGNQVIQFQSGDDLSGTRIVSSKPVAVLSGHTCSIKFTKCDHVYEQLQPTFNWGTTFFIPTVSFQTKYDLVYVTAATDNTLVTYQAGSLQESKKLDAGDDIELKLEANAPLFIDSTDGIQVMYYGTGGYKGNIDYDPVLMTVPDVTSFCTSFQTVNLESFSNEAILVAKTSDLNALTVDKTSLGDVNWNTIQGTEYSWGEFPLTSSGKQYVFESSKSPFSLSVFGVSNLNGFAEAATCIGGSSRQSCSQVSCRKKEVCKINHGIAECHATGEATCWASGDPHYHTFDGKNYDFQGTCSYTMSKTCDPDLPFFNIETVNENRGSSRVSYLKSVNIQVYNYTITGVRSEIGVVRINNQKVQLPLKLNNDKLILLQSGTSLILQTDFNLKVIYDWNILLKITVPSSYYDSVCGLCGDYNGNPTDDLSSDGVILNTTAYGILWKVKENSDEGCHDDCDGDCVICSNLDKKLYASNQYCGILDQSNGPFKDCNKQIIPDIYKENCAYDMCLNDGFNQILCETLKTYSDACAREGIKVGDWRNITNCPMDCPANSTYNPRGSACPATCLDPQAPSKCTEPSLEVCECDAGFVMIEGTCQPKKNCGCLYQGRSINPGESFWVDSKCTQKCSCNPITRGVECNKTKCASGKSCLIQDGIQDCYPTKYGTCSASGDPHYVTFDNFHYDFQGACQYLLSGLCTKRNDLADFKVIVRNENLGTLLVSYTTAVTFTIFGKEIQMRRDSPAAVLVDGIKSNLPLALKSKLGNINIFQSGRQCIVQTNLGIRVAFDWDARVGVTLPSTYSGSVCGLCGNFNNNSTDELIDRDGKVQPDYPLFGHSWREGPNADQCKIPDGGNCTQLLRLANEQKKNLKECGMVLNKKGPFRNCHSKIDPTTYFDDCVYDMCAYGERQDLICKLLTGYAASCQDAGVTIYDWRSDFVCPMSCPLNSRYSVCASGCPSSCLSLSLSTKCDATCREGCECEPGYVLSGTECVPLSQCGCLYNSQYYKPGEIFYPENKCENKCTCNNGGAVTCEATSCGPYEECSIVKGVQSCNPVGTAVCSTIGKTTFNTFDNVGYDFNGNCSYILTRTCLTEGSKLTPYVIRIRNVEGSVTISKKMSLEVYNYNVTLLQGTENIILVNDILRIIPFELDAGSLRADYYSGGLVLKTDFGLIITLDNAIHVTVPGNYHNQTCGLCGNYNDDNKDDLSPNDNDVVLFAESWKEPEDYCVTNEICTGGNQTCPDCPGSLRKRFSQEDFCGILTSPSGPFSLCYGAIDPKVYMKSCVNTLCTKTGDHCTIIQGYAKLCQDAGIAIKPWRTQSFCPYTCSENSHYELCADVCSTSCSSLYDITSCPTTCSEGCQCDTGYFFQNGLCVTPDFCDRCFLNGTFYRTNDTIISEDCSQSCTCTRHVMVCQSYSCASDEICTVLEGKVQCINKDPCKSVTCRNKEHCEIADGNIPVCVPDYTSSCTVWGDPHFTTFDGYNFDFHGTCTYILAEYVGSDTTLEYFRIEEKNDNRGSPTSSSVRLINIFIYNFNISILKDEAGQVRLNGEAVNLPFITDKISVTQSGEYAILKTTFGLKVEYDYNWHVEITIPSGYYATTGGLCGNFNSNPKDDKVSPDKKQMTVITKWAKSWKVSDDDDDFCWDSCQGSCAECNETLKTLYEGEEYCGLLEADDGPFKDCHDSVKTTVFFDNCVKDVCSHDGLGLCQAFEAYITECRKQGVLIQDWRNITGCDMNCPENSHYEFCGNACPATCLDKTSPDRCTEPCRETCQCNEGYVFSAGQCIDVATCGCIYKDLYYKPNQEFWSDDKCSVRCKCDPILGMVVCKEVKCQDTERCMLRGGVRDCYPVSYSTCVSTGDPHYTTFDGKKYDFMGTCTYQLSGLCPAMDPNLTPFQVKVQNDRRGSKTISYTKSLTLEVYNQTITLTRDYPHRVLVNGVAKFLPFSLASNRIKAFMKGEHAFVRTDFEVTINYNWETYGRVMVPNTYADALCGLCGNFNQDARDDLTPVGTKEDKIKFEEKYRVGETTECSAGCVEDCPDCDEDDTLKYSEEKYCGIIKKEGGPFSQCYDVIDPTSYFTDCLYDSCLSGGKYSATCGAIARYVSECQEKGVTVENWRKFTICDPLCPPNSHYELCGPGCHATCSNLNSDCQKTCTEGCYCDSGFVLSGDNCVSFSECGCDYNDTYYQRGQTFYSDGQCNEQCQCTDKGLVECQAVPCGPNEECKVVNGAIGCHSKTTGTCLMAANRHFITFDGLTYNLQGSCSYILTEVCSENLELGNFSIVAEGGSFGKIVSTKSLKVNVYGYKIIIDREAQWTVTVNEEIYMLPLVLDNGKVEINQEGSSIVLQTDFEVVIRYDTINSVHITVPSVYQSALCGQCGNFNGNLDDDLRLPSGQLSATPEEFGSAWNEIEDREDCSCKENCEGCDDLRSAIFSRDESCGLLIKKDGPFADCYGIVNVTDYFNQCLFDMCASDGQAKILCQSLQAYAAACQAAGAKIQSWRSTDFCSLTCPVNSHYELCTHTCDVSCSGVSISTSCTGQCSEGCECDDGYLFDAAHCVSMENCGCFYNGRYYHLGDSVVSSDCDQRCTCQNDGIVQCSQFNCSDAEYCGLQEGKQGCFQKRGTCTLSTEGSLISFDSLSGSIAPGNTFDLTSVCSDDDESWFRIVVITQSCKNDDASEISAVHVYFPGFSVALSPGGQAWLNGRTVTLPLASGALTVQSTKEGLLMRSGEDLEFRMSEDGDLTLNVHQKFSGSLCGACGNFNREKSDDFQILGKKSVSSFSEFIASWRAQDFVRCGP